MSVLFCAAAQPLGNDGDARLHAPLRRGTLRRMRWWAAVLARADEQVGLWAVLLEVVIFLASGLGKVRRATPQGDSAERLRRQRDGGFG